MIARLWWKETRFFWPAWLLLLVVAVGLQALIVASGAQGIRNGWLMVLGLCWAVLYAFVASSAAFAGERENETLGLLDALAVRRQTLWLGKATFTLGTTFGLAGVMLLLGLLGTDLAGVQKWGEPAAQFTTLLFEGVAWGLFWSALLRNPMIAGTLALASVGAVSSLGSLSPRFEFGSTDAYLARWVAAVLALGASAWVMLRSHGATGRRRSGRTDPEIKLGRRANRPARPITPRPATAARSLRWKTIRQGRGLALLSLGWMVCFFLPLALPALSPPSIGVNSPAPFFLLIHLVLMLVLGVGVFGDDTVRQSQRFLLHLGVRPRRVWLGTLGPWLLALGTITLAALVVVPLVLRMIAFRGELPPLSILLTWFLQERYFGVFSTVTASWSAFLVGVLAGMVFRRRITGGLFAAIVGLAVIPIPHALMLIQKLPAGWLVFPPLALLLISWAWAGDWLDARPGAGRWLRLIGLIAVPLTLFPAAYMVHRAWGIADVGPVAVTPVRPPTGPVTDPETDTALVYTRIRDLPQFHSDGQVAEGTWVRAVQRAAAELPPLWPQAAYPGQVAFTPDPPLGALRSLALSLDNRVSQRFQANSDDLVDLDAIWPDVLAMMRMARQCVGNVPTAEATRAALEIERRATLRAIAWAEHPKQTVDWLRRAARDLRELRPMPTLPDVIRAESPVIERTLDLPGADLDALLGGTKDRSVPDRVVSTLLNYSPWERERARREIRAESAALLAVQTPQSLRERVGLSRFWGDHWTDVRPNEIVMRLRPGWGLALDLDRVAVGERALDQIIALRGWALTHDGKYPDSLQALVPEWLDELPVDPFTDRQPFLLIRTGGRLVLPVTLQTPRVDDRPIKYAPGHLLLISVGPDGKYGGDSNQGFGSWAGPYIDDLIFPLP